MIGLQRIRLIVIRCLAAVPVLLVVSLLTFTIVNVLPGNIAQQLAGMDATPEQVARLEAVLRLDRPVWERYWEWLTSTLVGDLGTSLASGQPVTYLIAQRAPMTLELTALALFLAIATAIPLALLAARRPYGGCDRIGMAMSISGIALASYVLAPLLILIFAVQLGLLPSIGFTPIDEGVLQNLRSLALPALTLAVPLLGVYSRFLRGDLVDQMDEHYILTAKAKGLGPWRILVRHALPNSLFGLLTVVGLNLGGLIGGAVVVEQIFALPGIGRLLLQAIELRDVTVLQAVVLFLTLITVAINLALDVIYALLDPRIRNEQL